MLKHFLRPVTETLDPSFRTLRSSMSVLLGFGMLFSNVTATAPSKTLGLKGW